MARLLSANVGRPRDIMWKGRTVHTGIWKNPVTGRCRVGRLNLDGDGLTSTADLTCSRSGRPSLVLCRFCLLAFDFFFMNATSRRGELGIS
jgi:hypothetical protein